MSSLDPQQMNESMLGRIKISLWMGKLKIYKRINYPRSIKGRLCLLKGHSDIAKNWWGKTIHLLYFPEENQTDKLQLEE